MSDLRQAWRRWGRMRESFAWQGRLFEDSAAFDLNDEQILERLLALNLERAAEEAKAEQSPKRKPAQRHKTEHELI